MNEAPHDSPVNWEGIKESVPSSSHVLLDIIQDAANRDPDSFAREIEITIREKIGEIRRRFESLMGEDEE